MMLALALLTAAVTALLALARGGASAGAPARVDAGAERQPWR